MFDQWDSFLAMFRGIPVPSRGVRQVSGGTWEWVTCFLTCRRWEIFTLLSTSRIIGQNFRFNVFASLEQTLSWCFWIFLAYILAGYFVHVDLHGMEHDQSPRSAVFGTKSRSRFLDPRQPGHPGLPRAWPHGSSLRSLRSLSFGIKSATELTERLVKSAQKPYLSSSWILNFRGPLQPFDK